MSGGEKKLQAVFFTSEIGRSPVREWLKEELSEEQRKAVGTDMRTVELNWPIGMPLVRKLDADLWEVRSHISGGIARVLFTVDAGYMILLHGFVKKTQKTPANELETARHRLAVQKGKLT
jgi:phage-related protein